MLKLPKHMNPAKSSPKLPLIALKALSTLAMCASVQLPALAQIYWHHPPVTITSTTNVQTDGAQHAPGDRRIFVFRLSESGDDLIGIDQREWSGTTNAVGKWSQWRTQTNPDIRFHGPVGSSIAAAGGELVGTGNVAFPHFKALFNYQDANRLNRVGAPFWRFLSTNYTWLRLTPPSVSAKRNFQPFTAISWKKQSNFRMNVFGLTHNYTNRLLRQIIFYTSLREAWFDGTTWRFTDHGRPRDAIELIRMGPQSAVSTDPSGVTGDIGRAYVFLSGNDGYLYHQLFVRYWGPDCSGWCWHDLEAPSGTVEMRSPLAVAYTYGNRTRVAVFVALKRNNRWEMWGRHTDDRRNFSEWSNYGTPPGLDSTGIQESGFDMSSGVVWYQGDTLRINLFGTTEPYEVDTAGMTARGGGRLIEYFWDGSTWQWGLDTQFTERRFQTMSASVIDTPSWDRISVFGEDEFGDSWEFYWPGNGWQWRRF